MDFPTFSVDSARESFESAISEYFEDVTWEEDSDKRDIIDLIVEYIRAFLEFLKSIPSRIHDMTTVQRTTYDAIMTQVIWKN